MLFLFQSPQQQNKANQKQHNVSNGTPVATVSQGDGCADENTSAHYQGQINNYDPLKDSLYRRYLLATIVGVVGGFLGVGILIGQTVLTRRSANAARDAAKAASDNALAVINAERAWIMVELMRQPANLFMAYTKGADGNAINIALLCVCANEGKSIGWITEKWAALKVFDSIPEEPDFSDQKNIFHRTSQPIAAGKPDSGYPLFLAVPGGEEDRLRRTLVIYGYVRYRTIFGKDGETRFGYVVTLGDALDRLPADRPEYNKNT
jgi:hypothetical protein